MATKRTPRHDAVWRAVGVSRGTMQADSSVSAHAAARRYFELNPRTRVALVSELWIAHHTRRTHYMGSQRIARSDLK